MANRKRYRYINISDTLREIYRYIRYIRRNISRNYFFLNKQPSANMFRSEWAKIGRAAHVIWYRIELIFSICWMVHQLTRIITYFQTCEQEKLITTFSTWYFPSPSVCHKNLRFYWKLLWTIIYSLELEWKNVNLL